MAASLSVLLWSLSVLVGLIVVAVGLIVVAYWLGAWRASVNHKLKDLEPARTGFQSLSDKTGHLVSKVDELWKFLSGGKALKADSPVSLTELGENISNNINAKALASQHIGKLQEDAGSVKLNAFEIQTRSMSFATENLMGLLSSDEKDKVENEAFDRGMELEKILEVVGIELRNIWLKDAGLNKNQLPLP